MNLAIDPDIFLRQLGGWSLRGALCAVPSFAWALLTGYTSPWAMLGMGAGVITFVLAFAGVTASAAYREAVEASDFGWSVRWAGNLRGLVGLLALGYPDVVLGLVSFHVVGWIKGTGLAGSPAASTGFGEIYAITLVQGLFVSATLLAFALGLWPLRFVWRRRRELAVR